jgi:hypothetical protein
VHVESRRGRTFDERIHHELSASGSMPTRRSETHMSKKTKRYLMLLVAVGLIAVAAGGAGTFASFSAETANNGNYFATGTLFLHNTPQGGTTCTSESAPNNLNNGTGDVCQTIFTATLLSGTATTYYGVALKNSGTVDASGISFYSPGGCSPTANATLTNGTTTGSQSGTVLSINVTGLTYGINSGTTIVAGATTFITTAYAGPNSTSIAVQSQLISGTLTNGTAITFQPSFGAGDLCTGIDVGIIETDNTFASGAAAGCAYGTINVLTCTLSNSFTLNSFPTTLGAAAPLALATGGGTGNGATQLLKAAGTRYFLIAVKPDANFGNTYQNKKATVNLVWHIDQV